MSEKVSLERVDVLYDMLRGWPLPDDWAMEHQPHLSDDEAFSVVWFMQEYLGVIPDHYEQCCTCKCLYDRHHGGIVIDGTDAPDLHQERWGVTQTLLQKWDGAHFCSNECEWEFWVRKVRGLK